MLAHVYIHTRISVAVVHGMQRRRLHSRAEGGEPRREHYAVHLAFSLINGGGAGVNAGVVARRRSSSSSISLSFPLSRYSFFPPTFPLRDRLDFFVVPAWKEVLFSTIVLTNRYYLVKMEYWKR